MSKVPCVVLFFEDELFCNTRVWITDWVRSGAGLCYLLFPLLLSGNRRACCCQVKWSENKETCQRNESRTCECVCLTVCVFSRGPGGGRPWPNPPNSTSVSVPTKKKHRGRWRVSLAALIPPCVSLQTPYSSASPGSYVVCARTAFHSHSLCACVGSPQVKLTQT